MRIINWTFQLFQLFLIFWNFPHLLFSPSPCSSHFATACRQFILIELLKFLFMHKQMRHLRNQLRSECEWAESCECPSSRIPAMPAAPLSVICLQFTAVCCFTILFNCILISHMANFRTSVCCVPLPLPLAVPLPLPPSCVCVCVCVAGCALCLRNCFNFDLMHNFHRGNA